MATPVPSMLSAVADALRSDLMAAVSGPPRVSIGTPAAAETAASNGDPRLNLFLYGFAPSGFDADAGPGDPFRIRLRCIVTAYGPSMPDPESTEGGTLSPGEIDLRLLGGVMQHFHANPVREVTLRRENPVSARTAEITTALQMVFAPLDTDEINQLWSTQGEASYRPSVAYDLALVPITPWDETVPAAPVGAVALKAGPFGAVPPPAAAPAAGPGPRLDRLTAAEADAVEAARASPPELAPPLAFDSAPGESRLTVFADVSGGPAVPSPASLNLTYDHAAGPDTAELVVHRLESGAWALYATQPLAAPAAGGAVAVVFAVPAELGDWMLAVEAPRAAPPGAPPLRSNPLALSVRPAPEPAA